MLCSNCGKNMRDNAEFCPHCGAVNRFAPAGGSAPAGDASYNTSSPVSPAVGRKKRRGTGLLIGGAVVVVAVAAAAVVAVSGLLASPKGQVEKAMVKTISAYEEASKKMGLPDMKELSKSRSVSQHFSLELNSINEQLAGGYDLSALKGLGLRMTTDLDQEGRKMDADFAAYWGSEEIVGFQMLVDNDTMYVGSSQFLGDTFLGVNTETMGADLTELTGEDRVKTLSFNIFDLIDQFAPEGQNEETEKAMREANKALLKAIEVEKNGSETIEVNGKDTKTTAYHVVVPQDAMEDYVDAMEDTMKTVDYVQLYEDILDSMGAPKDIIDKIMYEAEGTDIYGKLADSYKDALDEIGDLELDVYLSGGYISAVTYSGKILGTKIEASLYLGGGDQYVDDLSLVIEGDGDEIRLESTGNHSGKGGIFTDETTIRLRDDGEPLGRITSEMSYDTASGDFQWEIALEDGGTAMGSLEMDGQLTGGKNSVELVLDDISVKVMGIKAVSLSAEYAIGPCEGMSVKASSSKMLDDLDMSDLRDVVYDIQVNARDWAEDMQNMAANKLPQDVLRYLMYYVF